MACNRIFVSLICYIVQFAFIITACTYSQESKTDTLLMSLKAINLQSVGLDSPRVYVPIYICYTDLAETKGCRAVDVLKHMNTHAYSCIYTFTQAGIAYNCAIFSCKLLCACHRYRRGPFCMHEGLTDVSRPTMGI